MSEFDPSQLESSVDALLQAYRRLQASNRTLSAEWQTVTQRNNELRHRLEAAIARLKALEQQHAEEQEA
jgi:uncharacterized protein (TIGR02449 family)